MKRKTVLVLLLAFALVLALLPAALADPPAPPAGECREGTAHNWVFDMISKEATCTEPGESFWHCSICGSEGTAVVPAAGHKWDGGSVTTAAACTAEGVKTYTCTACGATKTESIPAAGHKWDGGSVTTAATCTAAGVKTYTCTACGATRTESIPARGHTPVSVPGKAATCTEAGLTEGSKCSACGTVLTAQNTIPAKGHVAETLPAKNPTCTEAGLTEGSKCSVCGTVLTAQETVPAWGHRWDDGEVTKEAGYLNPGEKTYHCTRSGCHAEKTEEIPAQAAGVGMYRLLHNPPGGDTPVPTAPPADTIEKLHIVENPQGGMIDPDASDPWHIMYVKAEGGIEPYSYTWYKEFNGKKLTDVSSAPAFAGFLDAFGKLSGHFVKNKGTILNSSASIDSSNVHWFGSPASSAKPLNVVFSSKIENNEVDNLWADEGDCSYYCVVTDAVGNSVVSESAYVAWKLGIRKSSGSVNAYNEKTVTLWVEPYGGYPPYTYYWLRFGSDVPIEGADGSSYEAEAYSQDEEQYPFYICEVHDSKENICNSGRMYAYVSDPLEIWTDAHEVFCAPGETGMFDFTVGGGFGMLDVLVTDEFGQEAFHFEMESNENIGCNTDPGIYTVCVTDSIGRTVSDEFRITLNPLTISEQPLIGGELPLDGSGVKVSIAVSDGRPPYSYTLKSPGVKSVYQDSPEFTITDLREYTILVRDADGRQAESDAFWCVGYDADFTDGCTSHTVYLYEPDEYAYLDINPIGTQAPYVTTWSFQPRGETESVPLDVVDTAITVNQLGRYTYLITDKNGMEHSGTILLTYAGEKPWILSHPKSVTVGNNLQGSYSATFTCSAIGSSGQMGGLDFIWECYSPSGSGWYTLKNEPGYILINRNTLFVHDEKYVKCKFRCRVVDKETGLETVSDYARIWHEMSGSIVQSSTAGGSLNITVNGGEGPYQYSVRRHRDGYYPPTVICTDNHRYIEEEYPLTGNSLGGNPHTTPNAVDLFLRIDRFASDWYKSSGFFNLKKHYHRFPWTYEITVTDKNGLQMLLTYTCTFNESVEWASY